MKSTTSYDVGPEPPLYTLKMENLSVYINSSVPACNETNLMHYLLSSDYSVTIPLHVSGLIVAHHQEVTM
jgi:hypothetical protein